MGKIKLKKKVKKGLINILLVIVLVILFLVGFKEYNYRKTYEYKLLNIGYSKEETSVITNNLDNKTIDYILSKEYISHISKIITEKYYLNKNLDRYIDYKNKNSDKSYYDVVAEVNVGRDSNFYENTKLADVNKGTNMLVNKYNLLDKTYQVKDLINTSSSYSYANNKLNKETYEAFKKLANDAKKEGHTILILSSYRTYEYQEKLWNRDKDDNYVARAGSSEHQTGFAMDVAEYQDVNDSFKDTESFKWMQVNAHKYGFILRYPEHKENITGYLYEPWHYRYLGVDLATKVYNENITYDEYYAYYIEK